MDIKLENYLGNIDYLTDIKIVITNLILQLENLNELEIIQHILTITKLL